MQRSRSLVAAALTPRGKHGEINFGVAFELIDLLCKAGMPAIALLTDAGEYLAFPLEERKRLVYLAGKRSRAPLLAGAGAEDLNAAVDLAREALTAGAEGVILPPPRLISYPPEELREYYLQFAAQVGRDAEIWIQDASIAGDLMATGRFTGIVGRGMELCPEACALPELWVALERARHLRDAPSLERLDRAVAEFRAWASRFAPLVAVRVALGCRGIKMGAPPVPVAPERHRLLDEFTEWFKVWQGTAKELGARA